MINGRRFSLKKYEKILLLGFILIISGIILPQITYSLDHALIGFLLIYIGLLIISIVLVYLSYLGLKEAKEGRGLGVIEIVFGVILIVISIIALLFSVLFFQWYNEKVDILHLCIGIDIILIALLIIGGFKVFSYIIQREYKKR